METPPNTIPHAKMSDEGKLLSGNKKHEAIPEKPPVPRPRSGIRPEIPKSSAWVNLLLVS